MRPTRQPASQPASSRLALIREPNNNPGAHEQQAIRSLWRRMKAKKNKKLWAETDSEKWFYMIVCRCIWSSTAYRANMCVCVVNVIDITEMKISKFQEGHHFRNEFACSSNNDEDYGIKVLCLFCCCCCCCSECRRFTSWQCIGTATYVMCDGRKIQYAATMPLYLCSKALSECELSVRRDILRQCWNL